MQCAEDCTFDHYSEQTTSELVVQESIGDAILRMRR